MNSVRPSVAALLFLPQAVNREKMVEFLVELKEKRLRKSLSEAKN